MTSNETVKYVIKQNPNGTWTVGEDFYRGTEKVAWTNSEIFVTQEREDLIPFIEHVLEELKKDN